MSAITRACGLLARAWESENDPRCAELGVIPDIAREMAVAAQREEDQLRADLATATAEIAEWKKLHKVAIDEVYSERAAHDETHKALELSFCLRTL